MIDTKQFDKIITELKKRDDAREKVIALSRDIIKISKQIIYGIQRETIKDVSGLVKDMKKKVVSLQKMGRSHDTNIDKVAVQEYVEAMCFYSFVVDGEIPNATKLGVDIEDYLLGLCDLTGEFVRKSVQFAIRKKFSEVQKIYDVTESIYGQFLRMNLRNGELRKKSDSIKWNLLKIEQVVYDMSFKSERVLKEE